VSARYFAASGHEFMARVEQIETAQSMRLECPACSTMSFTMFEAAYVHRWILSWHGTHQWLASMYEGIAVGPRARRDVSQRATDDVLDGGGIIGASIDLRYGSLLIGLEVALRLLASFGSTRASDDTLFTLRLRVGTEITLRPSAPVRRRRPQNGRATFDDASIR
jgi:hypothetical protein